MSFLSIGDLATSFRLRTHTAATRREVDALSTELTTGETRDQGKRLGGDYGTLAGLQHALATLEAYDLAAKEAGLRASNAQTALGLVDTLATEASAAFLSAAGTGTETLVRASGNDAREKFATALSALNLRVGERSVFAGTATDATALADADDILRSINSAVSGLTTSAEIVTAVDAWFASASGGYANIAYRGSAEALAPIKIGPGEEAELGITANDPALRDILKGLALGTLLERSLPGLGLDERIALARSAAETLYAAESGLTALRADLGTTEAKIDRVSTANAAERTALIVARDALIGVDPYEVATALQAAETQLETIFTLTARLSRLNLTEYL